jgi:chromosome segregation ATPase
MKAAAAVGVPLLGASPVLLSQADQADHAVRASTVHAPHLHVYAQDQPVLVWDGADAQCAGAGMSRAVLSVADGACYAGVQQQGASMTASPSHRRPSSRAHAVAASTQQQQMLPFSTSQQISWEELEELPLPAKQEILSLRAVVTANKQQQRALQKQLQQVEQHLTVQEQELAASAAQISVLQAEHSAVVSELQGFRSSSTAADGQTAEVAADCSKSSGICADQLRSTYTAQILQLTKAAAAASSAAALQIATLQAQLDCSQQSAADAVSSLEMRLAKVSASKAKMQLQFDNHIAACDVELFDSQKQASQLRDDLQEALAALQESQQQTASEQAAQVKMQEALADVTAAQQRQACKLQESSSQLEKLTADLAACAADLAAAQAHAADLTQQLQDSSSCARSAAADKEAAAARVAELQAEVAGLKAGYGPVLLGLEIELAAERANAQQQVAQLKQCMADAEAAISSQAQQLQQQLHNTEASCADASTRSDGLQADLISMQHQHNTLLAQLEFAKAAAAAQAAQFEGSIQALQRQLTTVQAAADTAGQESTAAAGNVAALAQQLDSAQARTEQLQAQLEASVSDSKAHIATLEDQINSLKQQQFAEAAASVQQLEALCTSRKQQLEEAQARLQAERAAAQVQLNALSAELDGVRSTHMTFVAQLETELAAERSFSRRQASEVKEQLDQAHGQLSSLQQQLQHLQAEKQALEAAHAAMLQANIRQQRQQVTFDELKALRQQVAEVQAQHDEVQQRCSNLEAELAAANAEEAEEVAVLQQALDKQRAEMAVQVCVIVHAVGCWQRQDVFLAYAARQRCWYAAQCLLKA